MGGWMIILGFQISPTQFFMTWASIGYLGSAISFFFDGKPWMAGTMFLYFLSIGTVFMAGEN
jgi:hypothetical protein